MFLLAGARQTSEYKVDLTRHLKFPLAVGDQSFPTLLCNYVFPLLEKMLFYSYPSFTKVCTLVMEFLKIWMVAFCYWLNRIFLRHFDWTIFEVVAIFLLEFLVNKFVSATSPTFYYEPTQVLMIWINWFLISAHFDCTIGDHWIQVELYTKWEKNM